MRAMLDAERHSSAAIVSIVFRSSGESRSGSGLPATLFFGVRDLCSCCTCVIVVYCDLLSVRENHYLQKSANSQQWNCRNMQIGEYLRAERERLGLTQTAMSKAAGVAFRTYCDYEAGKSEPKASTLAALGEFGVDPLYVLTGKNTPKAGDFSGDEIELIMLYRAAPLAVKAAVLAALTAGSAANEGASINATGSGNRIAGRDYNENKK